MRLYLLLAFVTSVIGVTQAEAQDSAAGEALYKEVCKNCHGPGGKGMASFPKLVGISSEDLVSRLEAYRAGETVGPNSALMIPVAAELSDEDIANLAAYITGELN
jgi:cytochrome c553